MIIRIRIRKQKRRRKDERRNIFWKRKKRGLRGRRRKRK
jgi:hypothetical protein